MRRARGHARRQVAAGLAAALGVVAFAGLRAALAVSGLALARGAGAQELVIAASAFALDAQDGYVYWTEQPDEFCAGAARLRKIEGGGGNPVTLRSEQGCIYPAEVLADAYFAFDVSRDLGGLRVLRIWTGGGNTSQTLANGGDGGVGFAQDQWFVYWPEGVGIWRRDKLGRSAGPQVVVPDADIPGGIAVDDTYVYWTEGVVGNGSVRRHQKDGGGATEILKQALDLPRWIAVDETHLYWSELGSRIRKMPKAGGNTATLVQPEAEYVTSSLAIDETHVFFTDEAQGGGVGRLRRVPKGGNNAANLALGMDQPRSVSLDGQHAYFADSSGIWRVEKDALHLRPDLAWLGIEVTQGIQRMANDVSLVADKPTWVRAYPTTDIGALANVRAVLHGTRGGMALPGSPIGPRFDQIRVLEGVALDNPTRGDTRSSFLFHLPTSWISGDVTLRAELNPNGTIVESNAINQNVSDSVTFNAKSSPCAVFIPASTAAGYFYWWSDGFFDIVARFESLWPIASLRVFAQSNPIEEWEGDGFGPYEVSDDEHKMIGALVTRDVFTDDPDVCDDANAETHYVGMVHPDAFTGAFLGYANYEFNASWVKMETDPALSNNVRFEVPRGGSTLAQELAHNYQGVAAGPAWFLHVDCGNPEDTNPGYPYPTDQIGNVGALSHWGFDRLNLLPIAPDAAVDFMSYCNPIWTSDYTWENLFDYLDVPPAGLGAAIGPAALTADRLIVIGEVHPATNAVTIDSAWRLPPALLSSQKLAKFLAMQQPGPNALELQRLDGSVAFSQPFASKRESWHVLPADPEESFVAIAPWDSNTRRIRIRRGAVEAASRLVSANAPTVTLLAPNGGEVIGALLAVSWNAFDADGDPLVYTIQFSPDGGATWQALATDYPLTSLTQSNPQLPATSTGLVRVIASDGVLTGSDSSNGAFTVLPHAPIARIVTPKNGARFLPGEEIPLAGAGWDADEGRLEAGDLEWSVENVGVVGTGSDALVPGGLGPGSYDVTLGVTDGNGSTAQALVTIEVGPAPAVEVVFPSDGAVLPAGLAVLLRASAADYDAFAPLPDTSVSWSYDGIPLGGGRKLAASLPPGTHLLTLSATSAAGFTGSTSLRVTLVADPDADGIPDATDNCPDVANASQSDTDADGVGQACDTCPALANPRPAVAAIQPWTTLVSGQRDDDADGLGNRCDFDHDQLGLVITASDFNHAKAGVGKLASDTGCGTGGVLRCATLDQDEIGLVISASDFNSMKAQVGKLRPQSCGAACMPPFGVAGKVPCSGPAC